MKLDMCNLKKCFGKAKEVKAKYIGVKVWMYGFEEYEIIINPTENFENKFEYYKNAYNKDLTLRNAPEKVKIVGFTFADSLEEIENDLLGVVK